MVTKRTRVLSALAVVLMLVSMFTCFVLPAVADAEYVMPTAPANLVAFKDRGNSTDTDFAITDAKDWIAAATYSQTSGVTFEGITLWFTDDIDFSNETLSGTSPNGYLFNNRKNYGVFMGTIQGQGHSIKNMNVDLYWTHTNGNMAYLGLVCNGSNAVIRDLTVDSSCSFKVETALYTNAAKTSAAECQTGVFMGLGTGCTFINCRNEADFEYTNSGEVQSASSISTFGRQQSGVKLINCSNTGDFTNNDLGRATGLAEWVTATEGTTIYNCYNTGKLTTAYVGSHDYTGAVSTSVNTGTSIDNIVVANSYCVGDGFASGARNKEDLESKGTSLPAETSAYELAYLLNANYAGDYGRIYYTVENGEVVRGTAENQTIAIELDNAGTKFTTYVNLDTTEVIDLDTLHDVQLPIYELAVEDANCATIDADSNILTINALPTDYTINIDLYSDVVDLTDIKAKYDELSALPAEELGWYSSETETGTLAEWMATVKVKIDATDASLAGAYASGKEVAQDLGALNSFVVGNVVPVGAFAKYTDREVYTVSSKEEMVYLGTIFEELTTSQTIRFLEDIDMDGSATNESPRMAALKASIDGNNKTISGLYLTNSWLGNYAGWEIKDLTIKDSEVNGNGAVTDFGFVITRPAYSGMNLTNITFDDVTLTAGAVATTTGGQQGLLFATVSDKVIHMSDITIINSTMNRPTGTSSKYWNSGLLFGKTYKGTINADRIYVADNTITGDRTGSGLGLMVGEIICNANFKNVAVLNNVVDENCSGVLAYTIKFASNGETAPAVSYDNVMILGNGVNDHLFTVTTDTTMKITLSNIYADTVIAQKGENEALTATNVNVEAAETIKSAEAAVKLNAAGVAQKWAMDGTTPIFASETAKAAIEVTFKALDAKLKDAEAPVATYTFYTDKDGKLIGLTDALLNAASWDGEADLANAVFDENNNIVIGYTTPAHDHQYAYTNNGDGTHDVTCAFSHTDTELGTFACDYKVEDVPHEIIKKNISDTATTTPNQAHQIVDACKYCDYVADSATATDCTGTCSRDEERSWDATCAHGGMIVTVCDTCDYEFTRIDGPRPHIWGDWTHVEGTDTHKRTCTNVAECQVADEVEACSFKNWTTTTPPTVTTEGEETGYCECGNTDTKPIPELVGIVLNPGKAVVGKVLEVAVNLENNTKVSGLTFAVTYDADLLTFSGAKDGVWDVVFDDQIPAGSGMTTTNFSVVSDEDMLGDGTVVILEFTVIESEALVGTNTKIDVDVVEAYDGDTNKVGFEGAETEITLLTALIKGDLSGNRFVNMADAILLLRYYTEKPDGATEYTINGVTITDKIADLTEEGDGVDVGEGQVAPEVNMNDVMYLLRYLNGWYTDAEFFGE